MVHARSNLGWARQVQVDGLAVVHADIELGPVPRRPRPGSGGGPEAALVARRWALSAWAGRAWARTTACVGYPGRAVVPTSNARLAWPMMSPAALRATTSRSGGSAAMRRPSLTSNVSTATVATTANQMRKYSLFTLAGVRTRSPHRAR